ncbi:MAG TPA: mannitol dehydrogenase family protein, partial [Solirubrobacteraceae bacterium]|nr:mannitol dehydrogenase family protein [Solirubrobacteraceae bacterium]
MAVPSYDRSALTAGVVHLSVGGFHRSHQAVYLDELARRGHTGWGILGVGLRRREMRDALLPQDCLYTVVERGDGPDAARVVGAMRGYLFAPDRPEAVVDALADERTRVVTLTVTGAGYEVDPGPQAGASALPFLVAALDRRRRARREPFTVLSCDNVPANGEVTRTAVMAVARRRDERLARWIDERVAFPSSMVDRITPKTTAADRAFVAREFGVDDRWPVITEPYSEWIVEDAFGAERPPLEEVGVRFVADVRPYALMKTRLLNASHCALGYLGSLAGHERADRAVADPVLRAYLVRMMDDEVTPLLPPVPEIDLPDYKRTLLERLANAKIGDRLARLCRAGSTKVPCHVLSSIVDRRARGLAHPLLTLAVAAWCRYLRGIDEQGRKVALED